MKTRLDLSQITLCRDIAHWAHEGQTRTDGAPYVVHPQRVAATLQDDPVACCVAWLHDVIDSTGVWSIFDSSNIIFGWGLKDANFSRKTWRIAG